MKKAVIILPTYNEAKNIERLLEHIFEVTSHISNWNIHVTVVDSASPDNTAEVVTKLLNRYKKLHLIKTEKKGLGKAYIEGFTKMIEKENPYVMFEMDADLSHNPEKLPEFFTKIEKGADFVIGSRYIKNGSIPADWAFHRKLFSVVGNWIIRLGFMNLKITDWTDGYRAIKTWVIKAALPNIQNYSGYVFQIALLDNAVKSHAKIVEIPINFTDRREGDSKINSSQYIANILWYVFQHSSFVKYVITGGLGFIIDFGISYILIELSHAIVWISTIISAEAAIISNFLLNNFWSFSHKRINTEHQSMLWSFIKFNLIASGSLLIQALGMQTAVNMFGRDYWFIYKFIIIVFIIIPYSYILYNKLVWRDK